MIIGLEVVEERDLNITLFGIVWCIILIVCIVLGEKYLVDAVLVSAIFNSAAVVCIGTSIIEPLFFSCVLYSLYSILTRGLRQSIQIPRYAGIMVLFWFSTLIVSVLAPILFSGKVTRAEIGLEVVYSIYRGNVSWLRIVELLIMIVCVICIYNAHVYTYDDVERIISIMLWLTFVFAIWQYLSHFNILPPNNLISNIVYSNPTDSSYYNLYVRNQLRARSFWTTRLYSTFLEPSYFAGFLIIPFYIFLSKESFSRVNVFRLILLVFMGMMTLSATAYAGFFVAALIVIIQKRKEKTGKLLILYGLLLGVVFGVVVYKFNLWEIIDSMVIKKSSSYSYMIRNTWNQSALNVFCQTKGLGLGLKNVRGSGLIYSLLAQFGWAGTACFFSIFISIISEINRYISEDNVKKECRSIIILILIQMVISIGILQYSVLWMVVLLVSAVLYNCEFKDMNSINSTKW